MLSSISMVDYVEYSANRTTLTITKNPFGFVNVNKKGLYEGVAVGERGDLEDSDFVRIVTSVLLKNDIQVAKGIQINEFKALPETLGDFKAYFIDEDGFTIKNDNLFKRRILGLASYFRSAQEQLMPSYSKSNRLPRCQGSNEYVSVWCLRRSACSGAQAGEAECTKAPESSARKRKGWRCLRGDCHT